MLCPFTYTLAAIALFRGNHPVYGCCLVGMLVCGTSLLLRRAPKLKMIDELSPRSIGFHGLFGLSHLGFVAKDIRARLAAPHNIWEEAAQQLPELTHTGNIRNIVDTWPVISPPGLECSHDSFSPELRRAYTVLSMIAQSYVWCDAAKPCPVLPVTLAVPLHEAASALGLPSTVTLSALALWNQWSDDGKFNHQDTIRCMTTLTGTTDEEWFYSTMTAIQSYAGPIIVSTYNMLKYAVPNKNIVDISEFLDDLADGLIAMSCTLWHLQDKCNPTILCTKLLPLFGTGNDFKGVVFKGVIDEHLPQHFERPSTAQLAAIYVF